MTADAAEIVRLAERVEQATGPDRELDALVAATTIRNLAATSFKTLQGWADIAVREKWSVRRFTASLDAAMTLVPEGWGWMVSQPNAKALASGLLKERTPVMGEVQYGCDQRYAVAAATPALALCAAALRARAASTLSDGDKA